MRRRAKGQADRTPANHPPVYTVWDPPGLRECLRCLTRQYRLPGNPFPKAADKEADEARRDIFNENHIIHLLAGHRGPWNSLAWPGFNLVFTLNQRARRLRELRQWEEEIRPRAVKHNKRILSVMNLIRGLNIPDEAKTDALAILSRWVFDTKRGGWRPTTTSRERFWTRAVMALADYLRRTTRESESELFIMTARILHLATEGQFPDKPALVKQRYYRAVRRTEKRSP